MELNAEQVKKALECCHSHSHKNCPNCPYDKQNGGEGKACFMLLMEHSLALIKSQERRIGELTEENERLRAEVSVKKKLLDEAENRYNETAKRFYKDGVNDMKSEIKKTLSAICKGEMGDLYRMIDQIAKEMLEGK
jgi:uncharacterized small protein (DUF1192 family)